MTTRSAGLTITRASTSDHFGQFSGLYPRLGLHKQIFDLTAFSEWEAPESETGMWAGLFVSLR